MSSQLFPEVIDASTLGARFSQPLYLPVAVEGQGAASGASATVAQVYSIERPSDSDTLFGASSPLGLLVKFLLARGVSPVYASASILSASAPTLAERQAVWAVFESLENIRIRLTDSVVQADLVALADSCENADLIYNKQVGFGGMASGTSKAALITAAGAITSKRFVLVGPGIYDEAGDLLSGAYAAAAVAAEVAKNSDIADDLDTLPLLNLTGIEKDAQDNPVFRRKVVSGSVVNEFEDLLDGGVSPVMQTQAGGVAITHLRTTYTTDGTFDALMTRLIVDQVFIDVKDYLTGNAFLRRGNTQQTRDDIKAGVQALLSERGNWILPRQQLDGSTGYNVAVTPSSDNRQLTVGYEGTVVRGIQTIQVAATLEIPV